MDTAWSRFKRTLTFRRKKKHDSNITNTSASSDGTKPIQWLEDEKKVREGTCSFQVKYLGNIEVTESRGMHVCEDAIKKMKSRSRGKHQRAILYVSGDAIRVVDEITKLKSPTEQKGLIVDQTIEKVSFCSPDRNNDKAFAYICRDGTTRRWLCHGFLAVRDSGERLSHAVGCAFAVCLERKQQRERDCVVKAEFGDERGTTFTRIGSFRQTTLTEKLLDPQLSQVAEPPPVHQNSSDDSALATRAIPRPRASEDLMYRRYASMRLPSSTSAYDYSSVTKLSSATTTPAARPFTATSWTTPNNSNNPLLLPPPPTSASNFRRSTSLRLDGQTAAGVISRLPAMPQAQNYANVPGSMSTSSQLGASAGIVPFPRSSSANAGFSTPGSYAPVTSVPPSIPEEDTWASNKQVSEAADAVTQLCEQLTAGIVSPPQNQPKSNGIYSTTPLSVNINSTPAKPNSGAPSPFDSNSSARNPFLASTSSTPMNSFPAPSVTTTYFPAPSQWRGGPLSPNNAIPQQRQLQWGSPTNDPFSPTTSLDAASAAKTSNPFKDAPFVANF